MPPIQKILFGSPGTGKSYQIREIAQQELGIEWNEQTQLENIIQTVFHPEYTYADFVGKLLPQTDGKGSVTYKFYEGHFLRALGLAYKKIIEGSKENVLLVIDELNRGNAAAIFGSIFQLLDREDDYWSSYRVNLSELEIVSILRIMGYEVKIYDDNIQVNKCEFHTFLNDLETKLNTDNPNGSRIIANLKAAKITIPYNLSIIATINTSDESIYYLDSAFKRRWDWEYVDVPNSKSSEDIPEKVKEILVFTGETVYYWYDLVIKLNEFIKSKSDYIRKIEDKQIGWWFLKAKNNIIEESAIKNKLMFYLWDSVFAKDKRPLAELLGRDKLVTYADFANLSTDFINKLNPKEFDIPI
ncbi:AAA family ATPase [Cuspidothrix issatschenkoi LEGE 03284]|uniref:AAA family ATPase n=1 Tax=Cuspidothrix issatschenkoi TaxID=230752 RepID=UPI001882386C|nr:AAA family ATPase [Cuspidothrix issatschenkoi]MBE9234396.1 AAA family ATPase [Cuspidothrix issatschenkoi LEGE 03284]